MRKKTLRVVVALIVLVVGALVGYYFFFLHLIKVPTGSMANTILPGDHLVIQKRAFGEINRGDLIVFNYPDDLSTFYLSRVVGLPGETIEIRGQSIYVNNEELKEQRVVVKPDYESDGLQELSSEGTGSYRVFYFSREKGDETIFPEDHTYGTGQPYQIPAGNYFVMSDNRDDSLDSRYRFDLARRSFW